MKQKKTTIKRLPPAETRSTVRQTAPFLEHLFELRRRLSIVGGSIVLFSIVAYFFENKIIYLLLKPAHGEKFVYTSPGGGIDFLIKVCVYVGVVLSAPVIIYQLLRFIQPLIGNHATRFVWIGSIAAAILALSGVAFGYFFGLPVALNFLLNQFEVTEITALITISSYLSFVIAYLAGASLIFQLPLWMFVINKIKPLKPSTLMKQQRWVILVSFIVAALINPSPRPQDLFLLAIPIIASYEVGAIIVWRTNRRQNAQTTAVADSRTPRQQSSQTDMHKPLLAINSATVVASVEPARLMRTFSDVTPGVRPTKVAPVIQHSKYINDFLPATRIQS